MILRGSSLLQSHDCPDGKCHETCQPGSCQDLQALKSEAKSASCKSARGAVTRYARWPTQAITYRLGKEAILALRKRAQLSEGAKFSAQRFHEVAYHHAQEISFMTFRVSETLRASGEQREQRGIESYTFRDGRLATKDVYRKPIAL